MNTRIELMAALLIAATPALGFAQDNTASQPSSAPYSSGTTDAETGFSTRTWLKEQAEGINRGEIEAYRAESAGKAYRSYVDSIGAKDQPAPVSQVSTIPSN